MTAGVEIMCDVQNCPGVRKLVLICNKVVLVGLCSRCQNIMQKGGTRNLKDGRQVVITRANHASCHVGGCGDDAVLYVRIGRYGARPFEVYLCSDHIQPNQVIQLEDGSTLQLVS